MKTQYLCFPLTTKPTTTTTTTTTTTILSASSTSSSAPNGRVPSTSSSSLLDRFRVAVFRLIMVTALSKAPNNSSSSTRSSSSRSSTNNHDYHRNDSNNNNYGHESVRRSCYLYDPYHSEALADCIEFIKKKSASSSPSDHIRLHDDLSHDDDDDDETTRGSTVNSDVDVVIPLPVM